MGIAEWTAYLSAGKTVLDPFKGIRSELPAGPKSQQIKEQIDKAEGALKASEVELAKALGYKLCQCTFPRRSCCGTSKIRPTFATIATSSGFRRCPANCLCLTIRITSELSPAKPMSDVAALLDLAQRITQRVCDEVSNAQLVWGASSKRLMVRPTMIVLSLGQSVSRLGLGNVMKALSPRSLGTR